MTTSTSLSSLSPTTTQRLAVYTEKLGSDVRSDVRFNENGEMRWLEVAPSGSRARLALNPPMYDKPSASETTDVLGEHPRPTAIGGIDVDRDDAFARCAVDVGLRDPDGNNIWSSTHRPPLRRGLAHGYSPPA